MSMMERTLSQLLEEISKVSDDLRRARAEELWLPTELLHLILHEDREFSFKDCYNIALTCRTFYIFGQKLLWRHPFQISLGDGGVQPQVKAFYLVPRSSNAFVRTLVCHIRNELCAIDWTRREYGILLTFNDVVQQLAHLESLELRIDPTTGLVLSKLLGGPGSTLRNAAHAEIDLPTILPQLAHLHLSLGEVSASNPRARLPATRAEVLAGVLARWPSIKQLHLNRIPLGLARNHPTLPSIALEGLFISDDEPSTPTRPAVALLLATKGTLTSLSITCDDMMLLEVGDCLCQPGWTLRSLALTGRHVFNMPDTSRTRHPTNDVLEFVAPILPFHTGLRRLFIGPNNLPGSRGSSLRWTHALDCDDFWSALPLSVTELFIHCIVGSRPAGLLDYLDRAEGTRAALRSLEFQTVISMGHLEYRCEQLGIQLTSVDGLSFVN